MRFMILSLVVVYAAPPALAQESSEAEKLFRKMEKNLAAAKSVRVAFEGTAEGIADVRGTLKYKGTLVLAAGNKARLDLDAEAGGKKRPMSLRSDGAKMTDDGGTANTPEHLFEEMIGFLKHGGYMAGYVFSSSDAGGKRSVAALKASGFRLGDKEKVGKREAQLIEYQLALEKAPEDAPKLSLSEKLWLDAETNLPLKRVLSGKLMDKEFKYTETYSEFALNPKVDDKVFELPK